MATITIKIPEAQAQQLSAAAKRMNLSKSDVVREAIQAYLKSGDAPRKQTIGELAGDLIGTFDGPEDLATNPKYMRGFGE